MPRPADFDGDGTVGILDLLTLLANWGACASKSGGPGVAHLREAGAAGVAASDRAPRGQQRAEIERVHTPIRRAARS